MPATAAPKHCPPGHAKKGWCGPGVVHVAPRPRVVVVQHPRPVVVVPALRTVAVVPRPRPVAPAPAIAYLPVAAVYEPFPDWALYGLATPQPGQSWVTSGGELFLILDATREVVEAVGAVSNLIRF
jgi:hypothetical protein